MSLSQTWPCLAWLAASRKKDPSALNTTVTQVTGDTLRSTYCPSLHSQVQGPLYLDKVCPALYRWKITDLPEAGPALAVSLRWVWQEPTSPRHLLKAGSPVPPTPTPAATAPQGTDPACGWSRGMLLFIWSQWMWAAVSMAGQPGSRACAALRRRTVPGLGSAPQPGHGLKELCWGSCLALITALLAALSKYINRPL